MTNEIKKCPAHNAEFVESQGVMKCPVSGCVHFTEIEKDIQPVREKVEEPEEVKEAEEPEEAEELKAASPKHAQPKEPLRKKVVEKVFAKSHKKRK